MNTIKIKNSRKQERTTKARIKSLGTVRVWAWVAAWAANSGKGVVCMKSVSGNISQYKKARTVLIFMIFVFTVFQAASPQKVYAGLILGVELKEQYEDNVTGLLSDEPAGSGGITSGGGTMMKASGMGMGSGVGMGGTSGMGGASQGDYATIFSAEAGAFTEAAEDAAVFLKGFAERTAYGKYTDLSSTVVGAGTGVNLVLSDILSSRVDVIGKLKRFGDSDRNSTAYGAVINVKEKLTQVFSLTERLGYEDNRASSVLFTNTGTSAGITAGWSLSKAALLTLGDSYLEQRYAEGGGKFTTSTISLGFDYSLARSWNIAAEYDRQISKSERGESATDNITALSLRYGY
jgi:hypothetical protein